MSVVQNRKKNISTQALKKTDLCLLLKQDELIKFYTTSFVKPNSTINNTNQRKHTNIKALVLQ